MFGVPAIIIGDHGDARVAELGLAGELGLGHVRHADHVAAPAFAVHLRFRQGRELRAFHRQICAAAMHGNTGI